MEKHSLGQFLSILRKGKGLRQEEVAEKLGVSAKTISSWENDRTYPDIMMLPIIAEYFNVSVDELITGEKKNTLGNEENNIVSNKSILKIRRIKYANYMQKRLVYTLLAILYTFIAIVAFSLSCFIGNWILVFAILGVLGTGISLTFVVLNEKNYLANEGILTKEDYIEENFSIINTCKNQTLISMFLSLFLYFVFGFILLMIFLSDESAFIVNKIDHTKEMLSWTIENLTIGFIGIVTTFVLYQIYNKKYGTEAQNINAKKNRKLVITFSSIISALLLITPLVLDIISVFGPITEIYHTEYVYDSLDELTEQMKTYTVKINKLKAAGLNYNDKYLLEFPDGKEGFYDESHIYDLGNGFVYVMNDIDIEVPSVSLYDDEYGSIDDVTERLIDAYFTNRKNNMVEFSVSCNGSIFNVSVPDDEFHLEYDATGKCYYMEYNPYTNKYDIPNSDYYFMLEYYATQFKYKEGLYYRTNKNEPINNWVYCNDTRLYFYTVNQSSEEYSYMDDYISAPFISNTMSIVKVDKYDYFFNVRKESHEQWGYIFSGKDKGKYGYYEYFSFNVNEATGSFECLILFAGGIIGLLLFLILYKKEKYTIDFK